MDKLKAEHVEHAVGDDVHAFDTENLKTAEEQDGASPVRLDKHGFPLVPKPTSFKDDPLNWSPLFKLSVCLQISWLALLGPMSAATVNPAFVPLGKEFHISTVEATYEFTIYIVFAGVGPLLITPLANVYGRRPVYIIGNLIAGITNVIAGRCTTWGGLLTTRVFNGIFAGSTVAIGGATICDLYFMHERGVYMGIYTFFLTNGPHLAPLIGGYVAENLGWRQCFLIPSYIQLGTFVINIFTLPETLYMRGEETTEKDGRPRTYRDLLLFKRNRLGHRTLRFMDFIKPFYMLKYIPIVLSSLYYMTCFGYGTVLFASTGANLFAMIYHFNVAQTGLMLSIPLLIGCLLGEFNAGWLTDWMVYRYAKRNDGHRKPEARLDAIWLALLVPVGVILEGVCLSHPKTTSWVGTAFGMGIAGFGLQVATTTVYAYTTDCYKPQSADISCLLNVFRQVFACLISFYAIPLGEEIEIQYAWLVFAMINVAFLLPMLALRVFGSKWRQLASQAPPTFHNDT